MTTTTEIADADGHAAAATTDMSDTSAMSDTGPAVRLMIAGADDQSLLKSKFSSWWLFFP